jgi:dolichol-phosphate mannosyltransferase
MKSVSIVLPAHNEAGSISALISEISDVMRERPHEIIVVDDGSTDETRRLVEALKPQYPELRLICHERAAGQSAAIRTGIIAARSDLIATLDADGQNPPENLPVLLAPFFEDDQRGDLGLVQGQRVKRMDTVSKRLASKWANQIRQGVLRDGVRDSGCGLKAFPRRVYLSLPFFDHIHRFMPAMVLREGYRVVTVDVTHRERATGQSKYNNLGRALVGIKDLFGVAWLLSRRQLTKISESD